MSSKNKSLKLSLFLLLVSLLGGCNSGLVNGSSSSEAQVAVTESLSFEQIGQIPVDNKAHKYFVRLFNYSNHDYQLKSLSVTNPVDNRLVSGIRASALECKSLKAYANCEIELSGRFKDAQSYLLNAVLTDESGKEFAAHQLLRVVAHPALDAFELPGYGNAFASTSHNELNLSLPFILRADMVELSSIDGANIHCENNDYHRGSACSYQLTTVIEMSRELTSHISATTSQGVILSTKSITRALTGSRANLLNSQAGEIDITNPKAMTTTISLYNNGTEAAHHIELILPSNNQLKQLYPAGHCAGTLVPGASCSYTLSAENIESSSLQNIRINYQAKSGETSERLELPLVIIAPATNPSLLLEPDRMFDDAAVSVDNTLLIKIINNGRLTMSRLQLNGNPFNITGYNLTNSLSLCRLNDVNFKLEPGAFCYVYASVANNINEELPLKGSLLVKADSKSTTKSYLFHQKDITIAPDSALQVSYLAGLEWSWLEYYQNDNYLDKITIKNIGSRATTPQLEVLLPTEVFNIVNNCNVSLAVNSECTIKYSPTINLNLPQKIFSIKNAAAKAPRETIANIVNTFVFTGEKRYTEQTPRQYTLPGVIKKSLWQIESVAGGVWDKTAHAIGGPSYTFENYDSPVVLPLGPEAEDPRGAGSSYTYRGNIQSAYAVAVEQYTGNGNVSGMPELNLYGALGVADALGKATLSYMDNSGNKIESDFPIRLSHPREWDGCGRAWRHPLGSSAYRGTGCGSQGSRAHEVNIYIWGSDLSNEQKQHYCAATQDGKNKQIKQLVITSWPHWNKYWWGGNTTGGGASLKAWNEKSLISTAPNPGQLNDRLKDKLDSPDFIRSIGEKRSYAADMLQELFEVTVEVDSRTDPVCKTP